MAETIQSVLSQIANANVRSSAHFSAMLSNVLKAVQYERGSVVSSEAGKSLATIGSSASTAGAKNPVSLAPYFAKVRDWASYQNGKNTAAAVVTAASWFYNNVEKPSSGGSDAMLVASGGGGGGGGASGGGGAFVPSTPADTALTTTTSLTQKPWFWPVVIVGSVALIGTLAVVYWPKSTEAA